MLIDYNYVTNFRRRTLVREHANPGELMIYFSVALLVVAIALAVLRVVERRSESAEWSPRQLSRLWLSPWLSHR